LALLFFYLTTIITSVLVALDVPLYGSAEW
jgi:hypothetical protein